MSDSSLEERVRHLLAKGVASTTARTASPISINLHIHVNGSRNVINARDFDSCLACSKPPAERSARSR